MKKTVDKDLKSIKALNLSKLTDVTPNISQANMVKY